MGVQGAGIEKEVFVKPNRLCPLLGIEHPIILGGMARISDAVLAAAVSNAGGLGTIASMSYPLEGLKREVDKARSLTDKPFAVNISLLRPDAGDLVEALLEMGVKTVITAAGSPKKFTTRLKEGGAVVMHVVASVGMAVKTAEAGVDVIIAEGTESGGVASREETTTLTLIPQVVDAVNVPVVAAGGVGDARGYLAARALGAQGVQMGTVFLVSKECKAISDLYKHVLIEANDSATGIAARGGIGMRMIKNSFFQEVEKAAASGKSGAELFKLMESRMGDAAKDADSGAFVCGQVAGLIKEVRSVREIIESIVNGAESLLKDLSSN